MTAEPGSLEAEKLRKELEGLRARAAELEQLLGSDAQTNAADDYRWLLELNPQAPWTAAPDGTILDVTKRWLDWTGLTREEALGNGWLRVAHPDDLPAMQAAWGRSLRSGEPYDVEHRIRMADGGSRWMRSRAWARKDAGGRIIRWYGSTEDIEAQKLTQEALARSEKIYRAIGESIPWGIWICEPNGRNIYASDSILRLVGMTQEECSDFGWIQALHPEDAGRVESAWKECVRTEGTWDQEFRYRGVDGRFYPVLVRGVPVRDDNNRIVCWAGINLDIRRIKQAGEELERQAAELRDANRELEQFAFAAAHDLQEPIRVVNIYTQLIGRAGKSGGAEMLSDYGRVIQEAAGRMDRLVQGLLRFSCVQSEEFVTRPIKSEVALGDALKACQLLIEESGAQIVVGPLPAVCADEHQLSLVFQNLLSNAIKYRREGSTPRIQIQEEDGAGECVISVRDNGIGFPQDQAALIFRPFKRLHGHTAYPGTGLGLSICRKIVERLGGRMWAESEPGMGSTFYIALKRA